MPFYSPLQPLVFDEDLHGSYVLYRRFQAKYFATEVTNGGNVSLVGLNDILRGCARQSDNIDVFDEIRQQKIGHSALARAVKLARPVCASAT